MSVVILWIVSKRLLAICWYTLASLLLVRHQRCEPCWRWQSSRLRRLSVFRSARRTFWFSKFLPSLSDASVVIRPRTTWEAMYLGVLMAREHRLLLMASWAIVTLPVFILLTALLWQSPSTAIFLFWWLKPAFDRLPLHILSKTLFG